MIALSNTPVLETERLILRAPVATDYPVYAAFMAGDRCRWVGGPQAERESFRSFAAIMGHWILRGFGQFVITDRRSGAVLGQAGAWFPAAKPEQEIGWHIWAPEAEGQGIAYEAALAAREYVFGPLGWTTAVSYIATDNTRSAALAARMGAVIDRDATPMEAPFPIDVWRHPNPRSLA
ncbi:GNAT family N-acetyltransferase [Falsirhodobacter sp. 20TX0035]|uniref:GNAT family N-acetyltransferase n=1 Tax=Falsirhodobacter sp. 20TX0035 TaxID=3022019 RepID=UPI00232BD63A|nr:GNAT family N-acetyltransferase [Falsirhodobacter sp. 20TX0035]MDB6452318.1 GNAT family N-acetyltransferase [Falsirhodobacter sp. 20TX0035]